MYGGRDRSRSPQRVDSKENKLLPLPGSNEMAMNINMNQMMIPSNMFPQNNMIISGWNPNMMMTLGTNMISHHGMEMMPPPGMDIVPQNQMDMGNISAQNMPTASNPNIDIMGNMSMIDPSLMGNLPNMGNVSSMSNVQGMTNVPNMPNQMYGLGGQTVPDINEVEKKQIILKHCKLIPPSIGSIPPPLKEKPPGCRTIFVGGLPDKIRESTVKDIFEMYGRIQMVRLSKKNFCHIRFDRESSIDCAILLNGYRIKLINKDKEKKGKDDMDEDCDDDNDDDNSRANNGWLHVDYALSRDDQNEFERRQRRALREQQAHLQQQQQEMVTHMYKRSPSPSSVQPFSNMAISQLADNIKSEEHFGSTLPTLIAWLERGECSKKNANQFYSMIQATNSHIRRLFSEKIQAEEELQECREKVKQRIQIIINQLEQVAKAFTASTHQRVWDHFTKPQRKNIETWQKMAQEFIALKEEFMEKFEIDDEYNNGVNNKPLDASSNMGRELQQLKYENDSLKFQLEAYKNEVDLIKSESQKDLEKFKAQFIARKALQRVTDHPPLPQPMEKPPPPPPLPDDFEAKIHINEKVEAESGEAKLIGIMSAFLQVHPQGASLDYIVSYVKGLFANVSHATIHHVLQKHVDVFKNSTTGVGADIEKRWNFIAFVNNK